MANWFKIYETDLDETRLKYALDKLPEVGWIWIGILSECCKHRSDTIRWGKDEVELFGFSDRLKVSIPKVNESLLMLSKIQYIEIGDGFIKVLKWNEKQSDYCVRKERGDYKKNPAYRRVSDNIVESPREERRGDKRRIDKNGASGFNFPETESEALQSCSTIAVPPEFVVHCWNKAYSRGGTDAKGLLISSFPHYCLSEHKYERQRLQKEKMSEAPVREDESWS